MKSPTAQGPTAGVKGFSADHPWRSLPWPLRYSTAVAAAMVAVWVWLLWPVMHQDPFAIFITAVIVSARLAGFGPALLCTALSAVALDYFVFSERFTVSLNSNDYERLFIFGAVSILTAGLARQRSKAEVRAGEMRQRMAAIVEFSDDAIVSTAPDGSITSWNRGAERLYGYSEAEAMGKHISFLAPVDRSQEIYQNLETLAQGGSVGTYHSERLHRDGKRLQVLISVSGLRGAHGASIGSSVIARDVTELQRAEAALRRSEKLATAGRLAATIAHEINNPLEAVNNLLYLARNDETSRDHYLQMAETEVQRVAQIAQQTLGYVRESTSPLELNVAETIDQVLVLYGRKLDSRNIVPEKRYEENLVIEGFSGELRQLFANLIINAIEAAGENGRLLVRVTLAREWSGAARTGVRVTIGDNGSGIRGADRPHIFEPFFTTKKDLGTGLGLWLCHEIVKKHGGRVCVRSCADRPGHGTVFSVFLPRYVDPPVAVPAAF